MPTATTRRRSTPASPPTTDRQKVEAMLHEIAYILNVTRRVTRPLPVTADGRCEAARR